MNRAREIVVECATPAGPHPKTFRKCVGGGRAALGLRESYLRHLMWVHEECGFEYIRFHGLLCDDMGIYREDREGNPVYSWQYLDCLFDSILAIGMKPFVELSFMPTALASGDQTMFWWKGNVTPPKSYSLWEGLIQALTAHLCTRYGESQVGSWYFEVWNEPDLSNFFAGSKEEYFKLYESSARAIKSVSPNSRVGGPATSEIAWIKEFLSFCEKQNVPVDFVSTHTYGTKGGVDEHGQRALYLDQNPDMILKGVSRALEEVKASSMPDLELHITEWSSSYSPLDPIHDTYYQAPYILSKLKKTEKLVESMSYWTFSDVFEEAGPPHLPFHGGFGLINLQDLFKPAFFAYQFLHRLGPIELPCSDEAAWACSHDCGVQVLFWDLSELVQDAPNKVFFKQELKPKPAGSATVRIKGLAAGKYQVRIFRVGYGGNDVYTNYLEMGSPISLSREQVLQLQEVSSGRPDSECQVDVAPGQVFEKRIDISQWDVFLLELQRCAVGD